MESCCVIDVAKYTLDRKESIDNLADKEEHIQYCIKLLEAAKKGQIRLHTANLTISECQHLDGVFNEEIQRLFRAVLSSGRIFQIVTDSVFISERAQDLRWNHNIFLSGADAHHIATALEAGCEEFITSDNKILKYADEIKKLGMRVIKANETRLLPKETSDDELAELSDSETVQGDLFGDISDSVS